MIFFPFKYVLNVLKKHWLFSIFSLNFLPLCLVVMLKTVWTIYLNYDFKIVFSFKTWHDDYHGQCPPSQKIWCHLTMPKNVLSNGDFSPTRKHSIEHDFFWTFSSLELVVGIKTDKPNKLKKKIKISPKKGR